MDINFSPPPCPNTVTVRRNPHRKARTASKTTPQSFDLGEIPPFPHDDILRAQPPEIPLTSLLKPENENTKVFLRIRPLSSPNQAPRARAKSVWPQNPAKKNIAAGDKISKKKSSSVCILVNDSQSVTLSTPLSLQESKRIKSETYGGFSHVFPSDSSQFEVYDRMVKPMVEEFLKGRSGMLAALGPSGSGKTHTVFGCPRDPGMVPLAIRHIFKETESDGKQASRSFYISIFEIYSERGKTEKVFDLLPDGSELSMQQSTIKGLKEVHIPNAEQAESLIAQAVVKRATAMTNTNSQSSRSQCIINIRDVPQKCEGVVNRKSNGAVLTIIDLAGAEREKRTGNQGTRLLESNFINNTLMVFGLCLRSLLEHQKNPKKPLQKHFQNSMLTRYLRDYLEGKKRMTLILTAKSGDEDYLDTSTLLRQASPYMQIKYNEVEPSNMISKKRHHQASSIMDYAKPSPFSEHLKRARLVREHTAQNDEKCVEEWNTSKEDASTVGKLDASSYVSFKSECDSQAQSERSHIIMRNFAKVLWNVLKQYNSKLKVAETEIQSLKESIGYEKKKYLELETQFNEFKACCTCCKGLKVKTDPEDCSSVGPVQQHNWEQEVVYCIPRFLVFRLKLIEETFCAESSLPRLDQPDKEPVLCTSCASLDSEKSDREVSISLAKSGHHNVLEVDAVSKIPSETIHPMSSSEPRLDQTDEEPMLVSSCTQLYSEKSDREVSASLAKSGHHNVLEVDAVSKIPRETFHALSSSEPRLDQSDEELMLATSCLLLDSEKSDREVSSFSAKSGRHNALEVEAVSKIPSELLVSLSLTKDDLLDPSSSEDVSSTKTHDLVGDPRGEIGGNNFCKPPRPKRTLMPSSSILSRDLSTFDLFDETEKSKQGNRSTRKLAAHDPKRSNGSISLLRLLQGKKSNLHV
ncbi:kinesin-like protein KIN-6 [Gastrolobium bilobum]|uniref:kinesin-like protein KIN-6 n=1 Tax=Gastrolobium bilobum TaxID=150636 RepID=UPI002AB2A2E5|nr:kinesin-like protein KIN-6 [Gastrolobium bilobum]